MSFDPYECIERRWGARAEELAACTDDESKAHWYKAEQRLRNQIDRTYDVRMGFSLAQLLFPTRPVCRDGVGTDLLSPIVESRAQRFSSTAVYPSCRRITRLHKTSLVCGGMTDTLLQV